MAITLRTSNTGSAINGANPACAILGTQTDDVIIAFNIVSFVDQGSPTGYTQIAAQDDGGSIAINTSYLVAGASPPTAVTGVGTGNAEDSACLIVYVLTGVDTTTPLDVTRVLGTTADPPSITTATNGAWVIGAACNNEHDTSITGNDGSNLETATANDGAESFNCSGAASTYEVATAGALNPSSFTFSVGNARRSISIALRPASTGQNVNVNQVGGFRKVFP